jgi:hypothetical protein
VSRRFRLAARDGRDLGPADRRPQAKLRPAAPRAADFAPKVYGVNGTGVYNIGPDDVSARLLGWANMTLLNNQAVQPDLDDSSLSLSGPIHLDSGVVLLSADIFYSDTSAISNPTAFFLATEGNGDMHNIGDVVFPNNSAGEQSVTLDFAPNTVVDNENYHYALNMTLQNDVGAPVHQFIRARIRYRRQVSPDPAFSTFNDVLIGHPFHRYIEALAASGITGGCSLVPPMYCPDQPVTRGQMAVFLSLALGLHFPN